jgi:hypothetical protein
MGYGPTKTDRPKHPLLVHAIATLCKPNQDPAQLRLSLIAIAQVLITCAGCARSHSWTLLSWDTHSLPIGASLVGAC